MVTVRKKFTGTVDKPRAKELVLYAENDPQLYRIQQAWELNFARKIRSGKFNRSLALRGIANNFVPMIVRKYKKDFGSVGGTVSATEKRVISAKLLPAIIEGAKYQLKKMKPLKRKTK